jgi:hypothetical protein
LISPLGFADKELEKFIELDGRWRTIGIAEYTSASKDTVVELSNTP